MQFNGNIVLEGLPGSGKTTILNKLSKNYDTVNEIILNEEKLSDLKYEKSIYILNDISKMIKSKNTTKEICFIDRYFPSTLGYEYIKFKKKQDNHYYMTLENIVSYININLIPNFYILIETDIDKSIKRKSFINKNNIWGNENDLKIMNEFYEYYFKFIETNTKVYRISNNQDINSIYKKILKITGDFYGKI